jgi:hypothetical protein
MAMKARVLFGTLLVAAVTGVVPDVAAAQTGWMQPGVRLWYLGGVDTGGVTSSNAEEAYLIRAVNGTDATVVHHSALTHWTSPLPVDVLSRSLVDQGPCWMHPQRLQTIAVGDYWRDPTQHITFIDRSDYTYSTFVSNVLPAKVHLLPIKALFDLQATRQIVKLVFMIDLFSVGTAYIDADTGIVLYQNEVWGVGKMFFVLAEINYNFATQTAFAEDDGPHTGFKSMVSEQSLGSTWGVGGGSVIIQSLFETRYGSAMEMRTLTSLSASGYATADENYVFFGDVPIVRGIDATQAGDHLPEEWTPFGEYLWWWLPRISAQTQTINVANVPMAREADQSLTFTATTQPSGFYFNKLWYGDGGYLTSFGAKYGAISLDVQPGDLVFQNGTTVDGLSYYRTAMACLPSSVAPSAGLLAGGTRVTITGSAFDAGTTVTFGGVPATGLSVTSAAKITVTAPAHVLGTVDVVVTTSLGSTTLPASFRYVNVATGFGLAFDDDLTTDVSLYRPSAGQWFILPSATGFDTSHSQSYTFGAAGDQPLMGDFDGDGVRDVAVYRPASGTWFWLESSTGNASYDYKGWGVLAQGDVPAPGDYDGDGKTDPCVFRPETGTWFILESHAGYTTWAWFGWGANGDQPMAADYDGDGITDAAVYRPLDGKWYVRPSSGAPSWNVTFGVTGDIPVRGDFDGDLREDVAVYRPSAGTWFWLKSSAGNTEFDYRGWGVDAEGDQPVPGDYDGDGKTDLCVYRGQYGTWFVLLSSTNNTQYAAYGWGLIDDVPLGAQR